VRPTAILCATFMMTAALPLAAQNPAPPSSPAIEAPPSWSRVLHMPDGRTFVTDGGLAIDATVAKPATLPATVLAPESAKLFAGYLAAPYEQEIGLGDLQTGAFKNTFIAPGGVVLNGNYVNFLRRTVPAGRARLRIKSDSAPVVIVLDGQAIGVLMPVRR
jgi:hypothetical protein